MSAKLPPLGTCSFAAYRPWMGVPATTALGQPKWWNESPLPPLQDLRGLAPFGLFGADLPWPEFVTGYRQRLYRYENRIFHRLMELGEMYPGFTVVAMCHERDPAQCHRSVFATWAQERWGVDVPELTERG